MNRKLYNKLKPLLDYLLKRDTSIAHNLIRNKIYDRAFFENANEVKTSSARKVAEIIFSYYNFQTVFDIGCGMGLYISELKKLGKDVLGCDASKAAIQIKPKEIPIFLTDVTKPIFLDQRFDLVMCFEVAEHIKNVYSRQLVKNCTGFSDTVLFTAATVGQGGVGHINEQPREFWCDLFRECNFQYDMELSENIKKEMRESDVVSWIANNFMSFSKVKT